MRKSFAQMPCANILRYPGGMTNWREELEKATRAYERATKALTEARQKVVRAAVEELRAGVPPTEVAEHCPFTAARLRQIARENGVEPAPPGRKT